MDAFPKLAEITETELKDLVTYAEGLQKRAPRNLRNDVFGALKFMFRHLPKGVLTYSSRPVDGIPLLENAVVEVSNKRNGGNPKVRVSSAALDTSYIALITVADTDGTAHYVRLVRCACCAEENDDWFSISQQKSVVTVVALPLSLRDIRDELRRRLDILTEMKRRVTVEAHQILRRSNVKSGTRTSPRRVNKRRVPNGFVRSERGRWDWVSLDRCAIRFLPAWALFWFLVMSASTVILTPAEDPSESQNVTTTDDVHMGYYRRFFHVFKTLEGNETSVRSCLENRLWTQTECIETGEAYDYIDQLKSLMQDMLMLLHKMSRWMDMAGRDDDVRALIVRIGLLDSKYSYPSLIYAKAGDDVGEYQDVAAFAYMFSAHVEEFLAKLPLPDYTHADVYVLWLDAMAIRYWIGERWVRLEQTWNLPLYAKYKLEPRSEDGSFVGLPYAVLPYSKVY